MPQPMAATAPTAATTRPTFVDGHAGRRHLRLEHAGAARRAQRLRAAQVHGRLFVLTDADRARHLLAVRVHGLDDVVALGDAVDGERRGAEVTALQEDLDLGFWRRLHGDAPQAVGVGRPEVDVAQAVRLGRILRGVEDRLRLLDVTRLLRRLFVFGGLVTGGRVIGGLCRGVLLLLLGQRRSCRKQRCASEQHGDQRATPRRRNEETWRRPRPNNRTRHEGVLVGGCGVLQRARMYAPSKKINVRIAQHTDCSRVPQRRWFRPHGPESRGSLPGASSGGRGSSA